MVSKNIHKDLLENNVTAPLHRNHYQFSDLEYEKT